MQIHLPTRGWARTALLAAGVGLLFPGSCHKQKATPVPPQAQAPTVTEPQPAPAAEPTPAEKAPAEAQPATTTPAESTPPPAPPPKKPHHVPRKVVPAPAAPAASDAPAKTVVPQGSAAATGTQLTPNLTPEETERMRQATVQLLAATEANLKDLPQSLSREEQAMVEEIHSYLAQSRSAMAEGDLVRARNLADKAHLLSNALTKK